MRLLRVVALAGALAASALTGCGTTAGAATPPSASPSASPTLPPPTSCTATVVLDSWWPGGFAASVVINNTGAAPMHQWYVAWMMAPVSANITASWLGNYMQGGPSKMIHAPLWRDTLPAGQSTRAGFIGTSPAKPTFDTISCG